ncbi:hypothetical protein KKI24_23485 [bacterium]|nr:hypothetical protein [bacterium]
MLKFYGIRFNKQGAPERFTLTFALRESLNAGLHILDYYEGDLKQTLKAVDEEINKLFQGPGIKDRISGPFRLTVGKWFRTRDMIRFICQNEALTCHKLDVARWLNTPEPIAEKWLRIELILLEILSGMDQKEREEALGHPDSELNLILQMVVLFFLEQDDESPPANLELQFIRNQFPRIIWKKKEGFSAASNPFWLPENAYCRISYLASRITTRASQLAGLPVPAVESPPARLTLRETVPAAPAEPFSYHMLLPGELPDELRLEFEGEANRSTQLSFLPETAAETLLSLQKMIQKRFWHDGVKHLMAIFRQLAERASVGLCEFDIEKHLQLITKVKRNGVYSDKQQTILNGVFTTLLQLRVKRCWKRDGSPREISNPFLLELCCESAPDKNGFPIKKLLLDPIFCPGRNNPFRLGGHLLLIPTALFQESVHNHALLAGLASYIAGVWLNDFHKDLGVMEKSTREIIEGGAFNVTPGNKYRFIRKLKSELAYMEEKCYITRYSVIEDKAGNPWDDRYRFSAPETVVAAITENMKLYQTNPYPERLIA